MDGTTKQGRDALPDLTTAAVTETLQLFSHDIRSAMSDVIGGLRLVDRDRLDPEAQMQVDRVTAAGDTLAALVDAALMAAAGDTLIKRDDADLSFRDWIGTLKGRWTGRAQEIGIVFEVEIEGDLPNRIRVPQVTLDRIFGNLIGNALRHAQGQRVRLIVSAAQGHGATISVIDEGNGYPTAILEAVAEGIDPAAMGHHAGTGLGLRIAAEMSRQINATMRLSNAAPQGGGVADVHLPDRILDWSAGPAAPCEPLDLSMLRLLVAEDNLTNQAILGQLLHKMQADVTFVADGVAALEKLETEPFDVALIDIEMPRKSGIEVMAAVRARDDAVAQTPLVALTAYVLRDNREAIYAAGADGIIGKPISSGAEFGRAILRYAGRPTDLPEPEDVLNNSQNCADMGAKLDVERFDGLMEVAGEAGRGELLCRLHEDLTSVLEALDAGVAEKSVPDIRSQTHILIAISGAVGADRLNQLAEVLNIAAQRKRLDDLVALYAPCRSDLVDLLAHVSAKGDEFGAWGS